MGIRYNLETLPAMLSTMSQEKIREFILTMESEIATIQLQIDARIIRSQNDKAWMYRANEAMTVRKKVLKIAKESFTEVNSAVIFRDVARRILDPGVFNTIELAVQRQMTNEDKISEDLFV